MKKKLILGIVLVVVLLVALLVTLAMPLMASSVETDVGLTEGVMIAETADLAILDSEVGSVIGNYTVVDFENALQTALWIALGTSFTFFIVVYRCRLTKLCNSTVINLRLRLNGISADSDVMAGGPNKFIEEADIREIAKQIHQHQQRQRLPG